MQNPMYFFNLGIHFKLVSHIYRQKNVLAYGQWPTSERELELKYWPKRSSSCLIWKYDRTPAPAHKI